MSVSDQWRIRAMWVPDNQVGLAKIIFAGVPGGPTLAAGGVAFSNTTYGGFYAPANAFDLAAPQANGVWFGPDEVNGNIGYTFPAPVEITEVRIMAASSEPQGAPLLFAVEFFDGAIWQIDWFGYQRAAWVGEEYRAFTKPTVQTANQYWGILNTAGVVPAQLDMVLVELRMMDVLGGPSIIGGGAGFAFPNESPGNGPANAFDDNPATVFYSGTTNCSGCLLGYVFGSTETIVEMEFDQQAGANEGRAPGEGFFVYSQDGFGWAPCGSYSDVVYTGNIARLEVPSPLTESLPQIGQLAFIVVTAEYVIAQPLRPFSVPGFMHTQPYWIGE